MTLRILCNSTGNQIPICNQSEIQLSFYRQDPQRTAVQIGKKFPLIKSKRNQLEIARLLGATTWHWLCCPKGQSPVPRRAGQGMEQEELSLSFGCQYRTHVLCLVAQSCLSLCDPMDCSPPGSSVHGDSPGENTRVGCHGLLQGIFPTQESTQGLLHCMCILYCLSHQGSPSNTQRVLKMQC